MKAYPQCAQELIQYNDIIYTASLTYQWDNVYKYDRLFRLHLEQNPGRSWGIILQQAWTLCLKDKINFTRQGADTSKTETGGRERRPKHCYGFNHGRCNFSNNCKFEHRCLACGKYRHGAHNCRRLHSGSTSNSTDKDGSDKIFKKKTKCCTSNTKLYMFFADDRVSFHTNYNLTTIFTPVRVQVLERLLRATNYDPVESNYLIDGFKNGFDFHYEGPVDRQDRSDNLPFRVGNKFELWDKIMKEVHNLRLAGPYLDIPFKYFMQSPVGLVPKAGGQTRMIFHLSYQFGDKGSFNDHIPDHLCTVTYRDLDYAVRTCLEWQETHMDGSSIIYMGKGDVRSAFRVVPGHLKNWPWMVVRAQHPYSGRTFYFIDKNLAFGSSISCAVFQRFQMQLGTSLKLLLGGPCAAQTTLMTTLW